jgi:UDP-N-acetylmuramoyl-tripeptide--D-alanyl-D-alanine ligase
VQAENKMVILGEMRELGKDSTTEHQNIINILDNVNASEIWLVGQEFQYTNRSLLTTANRVFSNVDEVKQELSNLPLKDKMILIKGSNGTRLFELPDYL